MNSQPFVHIGEISLGNFRGFRSAQRVKLAPLTFLVGPNSSGKSSLADALLLLSQSRFAPAGTFVPRWSGALVDLGAFEDAVYRHNPNLSIRIEIGLALTLESAFRPIPQSTERRWPFKVSYKFRAAREDVIGELLEVSVSDETSGVFLTLGPRQHSGAKLTLILGDRTLRGRVVQSDRDFAPYSLMNRHIVRAISGMTRKQTSDLLPSISEGLGRIRRYFDSREMLSMWQGTERVSSSRGGPQRWYSTGATAQELARTAGSPALLDHVDPAIIVPPPLASRPGLHVSRRPADQTLAAVLKQLDIADAIAASPISPYHTSIKARDNITKVLSNLMELGYGASQVIPVIKGCLSAAAGPLVVEQPEIHLHPKAQGILADLLCTTSFNRQVIVETHSVRFINRARIFVASGDLPPDHVVVNYIYRTRGGSAVKTIELDERGEFTTEWPNGFFDERYEDTMQLLELRTEKETRE